MRGTEGHSVSYQRHLLFSIEKCAMMINFGGRSDREGSYRPLCQGDISAFTRWVLVISKRFSYDMQGFVRTRCFPEYEGSVNTVTRFSASRNEAIMLATSSNVYMIFSTLRMSGSGV